MQLGIKIPFMNYVKDVTERERDSRKKARQFPLSQLTEK